MGEFHQVDLEILLLDMVLEVDYSPRNLAEVVVDKEPLDFAVDKLVEDMPEAGIPALVEMTDKAVAEILVDLAVVLVDFRKD
jgi:hypothetical protein